MDNQLKEQYEIIVIGDNRIESICYDSNGTWYARKFDDDENIHYHENIIALPVDYATCLMSVDDDPVNGASATECVYNSVKERIISSDLLGKVNGYMVHDVGKVGNQEPVRGGNDFVSTTIGYRINFGLYRHIVADMSNREQVAWLFDIR